MEKAGVYILVNERLTYKPSEGVHWRGGDYSRQVEATKSEGVLGIGDRLCKQGRKSYEGARQISQSRLLAEAAEVNRFTLEQNQSAGSRLPESDREDMGGVLARRRRPRVVAFFSVALKGAEARGQRTANGFVVFHDSNAVLDQRPSAESYPYVVAQRKQLYCGWFSRREKWVLKFLPGH